MPVLPYAPLVPRIHVSDHVPASPDDAWAAVSDLSRLGEWLSLHEGWRGDLPDELAPGVQITGVVRVKGMRNRVTWTVEQFEPPSLIAISGAGVGGTNVSLEMRVRPDGDGATFDLTADFRHPALRGPLGKVAEKAVVKDLEASVRTFAELVG